MNHFDLIGFMISFSPLVLGEKTGRYWANRKIARHIMTDEP
jgi:hypothetical protein